MYENGCLSLQVWFSKKMFDPSFCFYTGYQIPVCKTVEEYMENIQSLPTVDSPQALGLHPNADITWGNIILKLLTYRYCAYNVWHYNV